MLTVPDTFTTPRLYLRRPQPSDAPAVFEYGSDPEVARYMDWPALVDMQDAITATARAVRRWESGEEYGWRLTVRPNDTPVGGVACSIEGHRAGLGLCCRVIAGARGTPPRRREPSSTGSCRWKRCNAFKRLVMSTTRLRSGCLRSLACRVQLVCPGGRFDQTCLADLCGMLFHILAYVRPNECLHPTARVDEGMNLSPARRG
jgi:Acetyltransferase (GNAT) domain